MNRKFQILPLSLALLTLSACSTDVDDEDNMNAVSMKTASLVIPTDGSKPTVCESDYIVSYKTQSLLATLTCQGVVTDLGNVAFTTAETPLGVYSDGSMRINGASAAWGQTQISDVKMFKPGIVYNVTETAVPGFDILRNYNPVAISYNIGHDIVVRTFPGDAFYGGTTTTNYPTQEGTMESFDSSEIIYRVRFKQAYKKADVIIYNARFAPQQPFTMAAILLKDLDVDLTSSGYAVHNTPGTPVVPEALESGVLVPYSHFSFDIFMLNTVNEDLTEVAVNYTVAGRYNGRFSGSYYLK